MPPTTLVELTHYLWFIFTDWWVIWCSYSAPMQPVPLAFGLKDWVGFFFWSVVSLCGNYIDETKSSCLQANMGHHYSVWSRNPKGRSLLRHVNIWRRSNIRPPRVILTSCPWFRLFFISWLKKMKQFNTSTRSWPSNTKHRNDISPSLLFTFLARCCDAVTGFLVIGRLVVSFPLISSSHPSCSWQPLSLPLPVCGRHLESMTKSLYYPAGETIVQ